ncbi:hypothetical protein A0H81_13449 [Grifola frondosa]|uniref:AB hydrolase-1 domain-containing protein n=1 Tax=Grifola frondosa TaxID=5627 RepID=A0A1C7LRP6_GRIFR|nr:hypothetical protein A0H81_13449 [Grifola frondosa]
MPHAPVDDYGTHLYYEDGGAPVGSTSYITIVLIHGTNFHSAIFRPLLPFAADHNLRFVCVNLRDYPGSTPYSPKELALLHSSEKDDQAAFIRAQGIELGAFLAWFIDTQNIPRLSTSSGKEHQTGGIAMLGWSSGNCITLSFLAHANKLPEKHRLLLDGYLRSFIIFDAPPFPFGAPFPSLQELYNPLRDPSLSLEQASQAFSLWVSSYHLHSPHVLSSFEKLSKSEFLSGLTQDPISDPAPDRAPTIERMTAAELAAVTDASDTGSHIPVLHVSTEVYSENLQMALFDSMKASVWPGLRVELVWCEMSHGEPQYSAWYVVQMAAEYQSGRKLAVTKMEGANHFVSASVISNTAECDPTPWQPHWDQPERTVHFLAGIV